MTKDKCTQCGKPMTELEARQSEMGNEFNDDTICDECFEKMTLEIAEGAFPNVFA